MVRDLKSGRLPLHQCWWRPSDVSADARLPVYAFIHGGGFLNGSSDQADLTEIVEETGVVGVSFNYRLGALGFFSHPDVVKESGDFGLMDQQAALRWVHENIAAFGGDPTRNHDRRRVPPAAIRFAHIWPRPVRLASSLRR